MGDVIPLYRMSEGEKKQAVIHMLSALRSFDELYKLLTPTEQRRVDRWIKRMEKQRRRPE